MPIDIWNVILSSKRQEGSRKIKSRKWVKITSAFITQCAAVREERGPKPTREAHKLFLNFTQGVEDVSPYPLPSG